MIILSLSVLIGLGIGYFYGDFINFDISNLIQIGLYLLLFFYRYRYRKK